MMLKYYLLTNPLAALKMWQLGLQLFRHKRMPLKPVRIKGKGDLNKILRKFREVRGAD